MQYSTIWCMERCQAQADCAQRVVHTAPFRERGVPVCAMHRQGATCVQCMARTDLLCRGVGACAVCLHRPKRSLVI